MELIYGEDLLEPTPEEVQMIERAVDSVSEIAR